MQEAAQKLNPVISREDMKRINALRDLPGSTAGVDGVVPSQLQELHDTLGQITQTVQEAAPKVDGPSL